MIEIKISITEEKLKDLKEYCTYMNKLNGTTSWTPEQAINVLALVRLEDRLEKFIKETL